MIESTSYIYVMILAALVLKERITKNKLLGMAMILFGILVFNAQSLFSW